MEVPASAYRLVVYHHTWFGIFPENEEENCPTPLLCVGLPLSLRAMAQPWRVQVPKLMEFLRMRSVRPGLGKLPIVAVIVVVDADDPR